jgi:glycosyltransferase involved in cell wall biosynthesis
MKICVIGTRGFPLIQGGVEKHCECLYPMFSDKYDFIVFRRKPYVITQASTFPNVRFIDLPSTKLKGFEAFFHSFLSSIYSICIKPDIVNFHNIGPAIFSPLIRLFGIKVVLTYHSANYEHTKWGFFAKQLLKLSEFISLNAVDVIVFVNKFQMNKYNCKIRKKSYYIPNGTKEPSFSKNDDYIKSLGLTKGKYVLAVGRITPEKGFDCLIKAFAKTIDLDYKLVIAGGVETESVYWNKLKGFIAEDRIVFTGSILEEKLCQLYTNAAIYILSSLTEGFPLVLLEAMSYHLPVLASNIPAAHLVNLDLGNYFPAGDDTVLANLITERLKNGVAREEYDMSEFKWNVIADKLSTIYNSLCREQDAAALKLGTTELI